MNIAFCIYNEMTVLDFIGVYDPLTRLHRMDFLPVEWEICARTETVTANRLEFKVNRVEPHLSEFDLIFLPGGKGSRELRHDEQFINWLQTAESCDYLTSVCTGSLLLGAAGFLNGRRATTHPNETDLLAEYAEVVNDRIVRDGKIITGRGVSSSIDLGLYLVELLADNQTREAIAQQMDYPYGKDIFSTE